MCYLAALTARIVLGSFPRVTREAVSSCDIPWRLRDAVRLGTGLSFGFLQALAPVFFRGNWGESFFDPAGQRILFFGRLSAKK